MPDTALARDILRRHGLFSPPTEVPLQLGPYRLLGILGEGGMARVYAAEHEILRKRVAIKTLLPELADHPVINEMFLREARIAGSIRHRNLLDIYDFVTDERGRPYCVMELAPGETLARRLERGPMRVVRALDVAIALADAVAAIHAAGYLHRDIKSDNVLLTPERGRLVPKLFDFGIARAIEPDPDEDEAGIVGTPSVMAPEQVAQDAVDERTDLWGLGVLLYEMTTGDLPFPPHATVREDLVCIVTEAPQPLPDELGPELRAVIDACLAKDPADRPPSAAVLVDTLREARAAIQ
ncbi:MAG TPA: serine/threonine-protein kinase [Kofleriaceae bacterium]|nr:serine/threonine-protein kinase [Kofleriaceae bacterium]